MLGRPLSPSKSGSRVIPKKGSCGTCTTVNLHARQVISGNQWYLHDGELADALDRHRLFEGGGVESEQLGSVVEAGLCSAAHLMREAISMQSSRSSAASGFAIRMQSACSAAYGAAVILLREAISMQSAFSSAHGAAVVLLREAISMQSACSAAHGAAVVLLSELHGLEGQVADVQYLWGKGAVVSTCMLSELHGLEGQVADVQYLWGKGAVVSTCMLSELHGLEGQVADVQYLWG